MRCTTPGVAGLAWAAIVPAAFALVAPGALAAPAKGKAKTTAPVAVGVTAAAPPTAASPAASPAAGNPAAGNPAAGNPAAGNPAAGNPAAGNPAASNPAGGDDASPAVLVQRARDAFEQLDYDLVAPLAARALAHPDIGLDDKLRAYQLQGAALAIVGDPIEAERAFLLLLSVAPGFSLPNDTPPKIQSVFAKVKGEFDAVRNATLRRERESLAASITIQPQLPEQVQGGRPLRLAFVVEDPQGVVRSGRVQYRRAGEDAFIGLPLREVERGRFVGMVPAEWTASPNDSHLELTVAFADAQGTLKSLGDDTPLRLPITAGSVQTDPPVPVWVFGTAAGVAGVASLAAAATTGASAWLGADLQARLARATPEAPAQGADVVATQRLGSTLNTAAVVAWAATGVAVAAAVVLGVFTDWDGDAPRGDETPGGSMGPAAR